MRVTKSKIQAMNGGKESRGMAAAEEQKTTEAAKTAGSASAKGSAKASGKKGGARPGSGRKLVAA